MPDNPFALFDKDYYESGARGGFRNYRYDDSEQQKQLGFKFEHCNWGGDYGSILFIGCARGFEVKYFLDRGKNTYGVDVSEWAINNRLPEIASRVALYDGCHLRSMQDNSYDAVASFDCLTLVPEDIIKTLCSEIVRVAKDKIIIRTITKNWRNLGEKWDGEDGVRFRYLTFSEWDRMFTDTGKFGLLEGHVWHQYEGVYVWKRIC